MSVVTVEQRGPVTIVAINRPEKRNAINKEVAIALQREFAQFDRSGQRVAILTGAGGRAFSAGADITDLPELWRCVPNVGIVTEKTDHRRRRRLVHRRRPRHGDDVRSPGRHRERQSLLS